MKKLVLAVLFFLAVSFSFAQGVIPNGDFTLWSSFQGGTSTGNGDMDPNGWITTDSIIYNVLVLGYPGNVIRDATHPAGTTTPYCMYLSNKNFNLPGGVKKVPALAIAGSGKIDMGFHITGGYPFTERPDSMVWWMQYSHTFNGDTAQILVLLTKWNTGTNSRDTVGVLDKKYMAGAIGTQADTITYRAYGNPDTCMLLIRTSLTFPTVDTTSWMRVDDFMFKGVDTTHAPNPGAVREVNKTSLGISVYPNPANSEINISLSENTSGTLSITNIIGQKVQEIKLDRQISRIDVSKLEKGVYIYHFTSSEGTLSRTGRLVINR